MDPGLFRPTVTRHDLVQIERAAPSLDGIPLVVGLGAGMHERVTVMVSSALLFGRHLIAQVDRTLPYSLEAYQPKTGRTDLHTECHNG
jgi:hypothetical protein